jgi:hypothetical protein
LFRVREPSLPQSDHEWESTTLVEFGEDKLPVNSYFARRPERVLGRMTAGTGMYRGALIVQAGLDDAPSALDGVLRQIVTEARGAGAAG